MRCSVPLAFTSPRLPPKRSSFHHTRSISQSSPFRTYIIKAWSFPPGSCKFPRPSNAGSVRPQQHAIITPSAEDFRNIQDPFASPSSLLTEKPFPLFGAARIEHAKKKSVSILLATTRHLSPADLILPQKFLQSLEDDTPPPSPPAIALVRVPRHASYSGALGA